MRVRWTRLALNDLISARDHLSVESPRAADGMLRRVASTIQKLRTHPGMGRVAPERRSLGYREMMIPPYGLVYAVSGAEIQVLRFWHARRDPAGIQLDGCAA